MHVVVKANKAKKVISVLEKVRGKCFCDCGLVFFDRVRVLSSKHLIPELPLEALRLAI